MFKLDQEDQKRYFVEEGDPGFNPDRNKKIIADTIKKTEANHRKRQKQWEEKVMERSDAVASYLCSNAVQSGKPIEKYLGKRNLAYLRGKRIVQELQSNGMMRLFELPEGEYAK